MYRYFTDLDFWWAMQGGLKCWHESFPLLLIRHAGSRFARRDSVRIESNRKVPQTNRLSLGVLDMDDLLGRQACWPVISIVVFEKCFVGRTISLLHSLLYSFTPSFHHLLRVHPLHSSTPPLPHFLSSVAHSHFNATSWLFSPSIASLSVHFYPKNR